MDLDSGMKAVTLGGLFLIVSIDLYYILRSFFSLLFAAGFRSLWFVQQKISLLTTVAMILHLRFDATATQQSY